MCGGLVSHSEDCNNSRLLYGLVSHAKALRGISLPIFVHTVSYMGVAFRCSLSHALLLLTQRPTEMAVRYSCSTLLGVENRSGMPLHVRTRSIGTNDRVLKVPAVQAPYRTGRGRGFFFLGIAKRIEDHESTTPFTHHFASS